MKTIDITAKEWFDKVNGNSYFSARIIVDYGMPTEQTILMPFQYGYGSYYEFEAIKYLKKAGLISEDIDRVSTWSYCDKNNIILRSNKITRCLKRDVVAFGIE